MMDEEYKLNCFFYKWRIENFNFCWHKTGDHLESPLFCIEWLPKTSWRLWLYPRGEEDGEYVSCYLFRAEGGPEVVDVDFELSFSVRERLVKPPVSFEKIYSFKNFQKEGDKSFALRREIFFNNFYWEKRCTLTVGCRMFKRNGDRSEVTDGFGRTTIYWESISGMDVLDDDADLNLQTNKDIEVKQLLEANPIISINLSYFDKIITIKIHPKSCEKIKYAICKITLIKSWDRKSPIEHDRYWVGEIKIDSWTCDVILPETESDKQDIVTNIPKILFLHYDFAYSTGAEYTNNELNDYGTDLWIENISSLESASEKVKTEESTDYLTAMNALQHFREYQSFADVTIKTETYSFKAHKVILRFRSSELAKLLEDNPENIELGGYGDFIIWRFLLFLYTDRVEDMQCDIVMDLYSMAEKYKVELLKKKCSRLIALNCHPKNVGKLFFFSEHFKDLPLKIYLMKYIVAHDEEVFSTDEWQNFAEENWELAETCMLFKYRKYVL